MMFYYSQRFLIIGLMLLSPLLVFSQYSFFKGYVVKSSGDTLKGYVQGKERGGNPIIVKYKPDLDAKTQQFSIDDCIGFGIYDKEIYEKYKVDISLSAERLDQLSTGIDTSSVNKEVFLQVLQKGKNVSLYSYEDEIKIRFYVKEKDDLVPLELKRYMYYHPTNTPKTIQNNRYRNSISVLFKKYGISEKEETKLPYLVYDQSDLLKVVSVINDEKPIKSKYSRVSFFVGGGIFNSKAYYKEGVLGGSDASEKYSISPFVVGGVDIFANPIYRRTLLRAELGFFYSSGDISKATSSTPNDKAEHQFKQYTAFLSILFIHNFYNSTNFKMYLGGGYTMHYANTADNNLSLKYTPGAIDSSGPGPELSSIYFGVPLKLGVLVNKKIDVNVNYQLPTGLADYFDFSIKTQRFGLGVTYHLSKQTK